MLLGDGGPFLLLAVGVVLVAVIAVLGWQAEKRRREALFAWCARHGWTWVGEDDSLTTRWRGAPFGLGERRRARNVVRGMVGSRPALAFDYTYETSSTDSKGNRSTTTHRFSVIAVGLPVPLPRLQVTPDNVFKRAAAAVGLGAEDIQLESDDFNKRFRVVAEDRRFAFDVLHPRLMSTLLAAPPAAWRFDGFEIVSWENGRMDPDRALVRAMMLSSIVDAVPTFVWKDRGLGERPSVPPPSVPPPSVPPPSVPPKPVSPTDPEEQA